MSVFVFITYNYLQSINYLKSKLTFRPVKSPRLAVFCNDLLLIKCFCDLIGERQDRTVFVQASLRTGLSLDCSLQFLQNQHDSTNIHEKVK